MVQTKGTKEFADNNFNWCYGCNNNCVYCYSKWMAVKFKRIQSESEWEIMRPNLKITNKKRFKKYDGIIMTPTSHDITEDSIDTGIKLYKKLLETGNEFRNQRTVVSILEINNLIFFYFNFISNFWFRTMQSSCIKN